MIAPRDRKLLLGAWAVVVALVLGAWGLGAFRVADHALDDYRFDVRGTQRPDPGIVLVLIDDNTLQEVGQFPFPRAEHARLLDRLRRAGARLVVYDVVFAEPSRDPEQDDQLIRAMARSSVVIGAAETDDDGRPNVLGGVAAEIGAGVGSVNFAPDDHGRIRTMAARVDGLQTLAVAAALRLGHRDAGRGRLAGGDVPIDYAGPDGTYPSFGFADVLKGRVPAARLRGRTVIVGGSNPVLQDLHPTPTAALMSGPEIQANALATILSGLPLRAAPGWLTVLLTLLAAGLPALAALRVGPWRLIATVVAGGVALAALDLILFTAFGLQAEMVAPFAALGTSVAVTMLIGVLSARYEAAAARLRAVEAADESRRAVERDLHDGAQQRLMALALELDGNGDRRGAAQVRAAVDELRQLTRGVYPHALVEGGLDAGLEEFVERMPATVRLQGHTGRRLARATETVAYFTVSEGVTNALKHASASTIDVRVAVEGRWLVVSVVDDGCGGADASGSGLSGVRERVSAHGGSLDLRSGPGAGTALSLRLPL